jgi:hypothetical protein
MTKFKSCITLAALMMAAPAMAYESCAHFPNMADRVACARAKHCCAHSNAAEMTIQHFMPPSWSIQEISHPIAAEIVNQNPKWAAWESKLICPPCACECRERK